MGLVVVISGLFLVPQNHVRHNNLSLSVTKQAPLVNVNWQSGNAPSGYIAACFAAAGCDAITQHCTTFNKLLFPLVTWTREYGEIWSRLKNTEVTLWPYHLALWIDRKTNWPQLWCHLNQWDWPFTTDKGHHLKSVLFLWNEALPPHEVWLCYTTNVMKFGENRRVYQCHFFRVLNVDIWGEGAGIFFSSVLRRELIVFEAWTTLYLRGTGPGAA